MTQTCDILICGAALAGLATALALGGAQAERPLEVIIADARDPHAFTAEDFDSRASAITASSRRMFEVLGVWDRLAAVAQEIARIDVTDETAGSPQRPALLQFAAEGNSSFHMVENRHLFSALLDAVKAAPGVRLITGELADRFRFGPGRAEVQFKSGLAIKADLVIGADGRNSAARTAAGISTWGWDYGQTGMVSRVRHELAHGGVALESFRPGGPFAVLPLTGNRASIVWCERTDAARRIMARDEAGFAGELRHAFGDRLGVVTPDGPRHAHPLSLLMAREMAGPRLALIGDAAHALHPLAGLGFNLALRDAAALAECVAGAIALGLDPGGAAVLDRYVRWRRFDTAMTAFLTDGFNRLFSNDLSGVAALRKAGLVLANAMSPLKPLIMREAAGDLGNLPKLLRGEAV